MKIVVAYRAIDGIAGGVERMSTALMNEMCERGHDVHFYTIDHADARSYYDMDLRITWHKLNMGDPSEKAAWGLRFKRFIKARKIFKSIKPDLILAFQDGAFLSTRVYTAFSGIPVILAERVSPQHFDYQPAGRFKNLIRQTYRLAKKITIQCESYRDLYPNYLRAKLVTISNPVFPADPRAEPDLAINSQKTLLCVGRTSFQKNQSVLIKAFLDLAEDFPDWRLSLAGEGEDLETLLELSGDHPQIQFLGNVEDVSSLYASAHLFCLPSRWEGFPNALAEALAHGLPAVGFEDCGGVRDLIMDGENGLLTEGGEDPDTLREALRCLMADDEARKNMGIAATKSVQQYEPEKIFHQWEELFKTVIRS